MELESSREECQKQRRELEILQVRCRIELLDELLLRTSRLSHREKLNDHQVKAQEVASLEVKQAQHQQFMFELKTQLQKVITASEGNHCYMCCYRSVHEIATVCAAS